MQFATWGTLAVASLAVGKLLETVGMEAVSPIPLVIAALLLVWLNRSSRIASAMGSSLVLLLLSRSILVPGSLATTAPIWVVIVLGWALVLSRERLRMPRNAWALALLSLSLAIPSLVQTDTTTSVKALGISIMWFVVFYSAANLTSLERRLFFRTIVIAGAVEALLAIGETLLQIDVLRTYVVGSIADREYVVRPNTILGDWTNRAQGTTGYPMPFATFIAIAALTLQFGRVVSRPWLKYAGLTLFLVALLLSGARSAFVAIALGLAIAIVTLAITARRQGKKMPGLKWMIAAFALLVLFGAAALVKAISTNDFSLTHRSGVIESAAGVFSLPLPQVIFGSGYNSSEQLFASGLLHTTSIAVVDNTLLTQLIFSGVVGLVILCYVIGWAFAHSGVLGRAVIAAVVASFFFYDIFVWHLCAFLIFAFVGLASCNSPRTRDYAETEERAGGRPATATTALP